MPPRPTSSNLENRRPPLHLCDLSKTTTRSALTVDLAAQGSLRVASGWLRGAYRLATRWPEGGLGVASGQPGRYSARKQRRTESGRFFRGANRAVLPETHRRGQQLQSEARNAKNTPESAICGVLRKRPTPTGSVLCLVPISNPRSAPRTSAGPISSWHH